MQEYMDTSALIALGDKKDRNHDDAVKYFENAISEGIRFTLGKPVLIEFIDGLTKRVGKWEAIRALTYILESKVVSIVFDAGPDWKKALAHFKKYGDRKIDLTDALNFSIMERIGIDRAFTFDSHFEIHGFKTTP